MIRVDVVIAALDIAFKNLIPAYSRKMEGVCHPIHVMHPSRKWSAL